MNKSLSILIAFALISINACGQKKSESLFIAGSIEVLVGFNKYAPEDYIFFLDGTFKKMIELDSEGKFLIENLESGVYDLEFIGLGSSKIDTQIVLANNSIENLNLLSIADCTVNKLEAYRDIKAGTPKLLLLGGIAPRYSPDQVLHEKRYGFKYEDFGCISPGIECMIDYNFQVFKYLDEEFGESWRKEVRSDVKGLTQWIKEN